MPLDENPIVGQSGHLFVADRTQYILLSNTKSLYSTVMYGAGMTDESRFIDRALCNLRKRPVRPVLTRALVWGRSFSPQTMERDDGTSGKRGGVDEMA